MLDANKLGALGTLVTDCVETILDGLSPSAAAALSMLHFKPDLTATQLAAICGIRQPTMVRILDGLVAQGLVVRGAPNGRMTPLMLTPAGTARAGRLQSARMAALDKLLSVFSPEERQTFEKLVDRLVAGATTSRAFARTTCRLCAHDVCKPGLCPIGKRAGEIEATGEASQLP